jgi:3-deoxy-manno-octulosonate cytidylyltransferase (CMP-KDO synthetase)
MISNNIQAIGFIPARYNSMRLPGKPLIEIHGKPLIQWVWEAACQSETLRRIVIATDDERIAEFCFNIGAEFIMTPSELPSGTDRVRYAYHEIDEESNIILNLQGDEPLITGKIIDKLIVSFAKSGKDVGTLVRKIESYDELVNPSVVKVVLNNNNSAIYFSRHEIPYIRDYQKDEWLEHHNFWKHTGVYVYRHDVLEQFARMNTSNLENVEKLEQLRLLQDGATIHCVPIEENLVGVDTPEDIKKVESILSEIYSFEV